MNKDVRNEVVINAVRWTNNILVECLGNHGSVMPLSAADHLRNAIDELAKTDRALRGVSE